MFLQPLDSPTRRCYVPHAVHGGNADHRVCGCRGAGPTVGSTRPPAGALLSPGSDRSAGGSMLRQPAAGSRPEADASGPMGDELGPSAVVPVRSLRPADSPRVDGE